jgi:hypothetical protein
LDSEEESRDLFTQKRFEFAAIVAEIEFEQKYLPLDGFGGGIV